MALSAPRVKTTRAGVLRSLPVAANAVIWENANVAMNAGGFLVPSSTATGLKACGRAEMSVDNTGGGNGAVECEVRNDQPFGWNNSAGADEITYADLGNDVYLVDDETVAKTSATSTRSIAGKLWAIIDGQVFVKAPN